MYYLYLIKQDNNHFELHLSEDAKLFEVKPLTNLRISGDEQYIDMLAEYFYETVPSENGRFTSWRDLMFAMSKHLENRNYFKKFR